VGLCRSSGLSGKPIIDIATGMPDGFNIFPLIGRLKLHGYLYRTGLWHFPIAAR
jgi:hypothetical protein